MSGTRGGVAPKIARTLTPIATIRQIAAHGARRVGSGEGAAVRGSIR